MILPGPAPSDRGPEPHRASFLIVLKFGCILLLFVTQTIYLMDILGIVRFYVLSEDSGKGQHKLPNVLSLAPPFTLNQKAVVFA